MFQVSVCWGFGVWGSFKCFWRGSGAGAPQSRPPPPRHSFGSTPQMKTRFAAFLWLKSRDEISPWCRRQTRLNVFIHKPVLTASAGANHPCVQINSPKSRLILSAVNHHWIKISLTPLPPRGALFSDNGHRLIGSSKIELWISELISSGSAPLWPQGAPVRQGRWWMSVGTRYFISPQINHFNTKWADEESSLWRTHRKGPQGAKCVYWWAEAEL